MSNEVNEQEVDVATAETEGENLFAEATSEDFNRPEDMFKEFIDNFDDEKKAEFLDKIKASIEFNEKLITEFKQKFQDNVKVKPEDLEPIFKEEAYLALQRDIGPFINPLVAAGKLTEDDLALFETLMDKTAVVEMYLLPIIEREEESMKRMVMAVRQVEDTLMRNVYAMASWQLENTIRTLQVYRDKDGLTKEIIDELKANMEMIRDKHQDYLTWLELPTDAFERVYPAYANIVEEYYNFVKA